MNNPTVKRAGKFGKVGTYEIEVAVLKVSINGIEVQSEAVADFIELGIKGGKSPKTQ